MAEEPPSYVDRKLVVRRSVYAAAQKVMKQAESTGAGVIDLAEQKINDCRAVRNTAEMQFWRDVWTHLMQLEQGPREIQIIEDGKTE